MDRFILKASKKLPAKQQSESIIHKPNLTLSPQNLGPILPNHITTKVMLLPLAALEANILISTIVRIQKKQTSLNKIIFLIPHEDSDAYGIQFLTSEKYKSWENLISSERNFSRKIKFDLFSHMYSVPPSDCCSEGTKLAKVVTDLDSQFPNLDFLSLVTARTGSHRFSQSMDQIGKDENTLIIGFFDLSEKCIQDGRASEVVQSTVSAIENMRPHDLDSDQLKGYWLLQGLLSWSRSCLLTVTLIDGPDLWPSQSMTSFTPTPPILLMHW